MSALPLKQEPQHRRGEKRRMFLAASTANGWGQLSRGCGANTLLKYDADAGTLKLVPALCDQWDCPLCGCMRAAWLVEHLARFVAALRLTQFWTLTIRTSDCTAAGSDAYIARSWNRLRGKIDRRCCWQWDGSYRLSAAGRRIRTPKQRVRRLAFVWVREHTGRGYAHLHLLTDIRLPAERHTDELREARCARSLWWYMERERRTHNQGVRDEPSLDDMIQTWRLSRLWQSCTRDSWVVDAEPAGSERAANYIAKYVTEETTSGRRPRHQRAFSRARVLSMRPYRPASPHPERWRRSSTPYWQMLQVRRACGDQLSELQVAGKPSATLTLSVLSMANLPLLISAGDNSPPVLERTAP